MTSRPPLSWRGAMWIWDSRLWPREGTANVLEDAGMIVERVFKVMEGRPNAVDLIKGDRIQLIINTPQGQDTIFDEKPIRRAAVLARVPTITTLAAAQAAAEGIAAMQRHRTTVYALQALHKANGAVILCHAPNLGRPSPRWILVSSSPFR